MIRKNLFQNFLSVKEIKMGCKECRNAKNKAYREANKDKVKINIMKKIKSIY